MKLCFQSRYHGYSNCHLYIHKLFCLTASVHVEAIDFNSEHSIEKLSTFSSQSGCYQNSLHIPDSVTGGKTNDVFCNIPQSGTMKNRTTRQNQSIKTEPQEMHL